jgi:hypothetical protein
MWRTEIPIGLNLDSTVFSVVSCVCVLSICMTSAPLLVTRRGNDPASFYPRKQESKARVTEA